MKFSDKFRACAAMNKSLLCVGLDQIDFDLNKKIIDQTSDLVCAYKPNSAFYEAGGEKGFASLKKTCEYIQKKYPNIPIIIDAKRGDIGSTNEQYAKYVFEYLNADAVTLHPYQGIGALAPFEKYSEKGLFLLVKTSNPESSELQDMKLENGKLVWEQVLESLVKINWGEGQWGAVIGATHPQEMKKARAIAPEMIFLVPGVGTQGGKVEDILNNVTSRGSDMIINASRSVINTSNPREAANEIKKQMIDYVSRRS